MEIPPIGKILELGCGIHKIYAQSIGIDKCIYSQADIIRDFSKRCIPFNDNWFDTITLIDVVEYLEHYDDLVFTFNEIYRVLKVGGKLYLGTLNGINDHFTHHKFFFKGSFEYFRTDNLSPEMEYMRKSDGIIANFSIQYLDGGDDRVLEIILTKV